jgi:RNA polymerase sigma factor (sigma-70 family)
MQKSDVELIEACRRGDESAWEALVLKYQKLIYAIPRRAGVNDDQASEIFQDVFTTLFSKLNDIDEPDRLHAWLVTTTKRKTWKSIAKAKTWQQFDTDDDDERSFTDELQSIPDGAILQDESIIQLEEQHKLRTAVAALDDRCRNLIQLLFYATSPPAYSEVALALKIPEGSIGPTRARCLAKMLRLLQKS